MSNSLASPRCCGFLRSKCLGWLMLALACGGVVSFPALAATPLHGIAATFNGFDYDKDGIKEIELLRLMWERSKLFDSPQAVIEPKSQLVLVLVESRLLQELPDGRYDELLEKLARLRWDLKVERYDARFLELKDYDGANCQDGKTLLGIREFLRSVKSSYQNFQGVLLIGSFPDAGIVRNYPGYDAQNSRYYVGRTAGKPRPMDIVLADLDGSWEKLYRQAPAQVPGCQFSCTASTTTSRNGTVVTLIRPMVETNSEVRQDFFWLTDAQYSISNSSAGAVVTMDLKCRDPEISESDGTNVNSVARPDIFLSRIDPRSIAQQPPSTRLLDGQGLPRTVPDTPAISLFSKDWKRDAQLERRVLIDYLDRNHRFRNGSLGDISYRVSVLEAMQLGTSAANQGLGSLSPREPDILGATPRRFIQWLRQPFLFRAVSAHAGPYYTGMSSDPDPMAPASLASEAGGHPWFWIHTNGLYKSTFEGHSDIVGLNLLRTVWENKLLETVPPSLMLHVGCDVATKNFDNLGHNDDNYADFQNGASLLFYGNQVALLARTTEWNTGPSGFGDDLMNGSTIGAAFRGWFDTVAQNGALASRPTERKQSYIYNLLGDGTLRRHYRQQKNDQAWTAQVIPVNGSLMTGNAIAGSIADPELIPGFGKGVWFSIDAPAGALTIDTKDSAFDTVMQVYRGPWYDLSPFPNGFSDDDGSSPQACVRLLLSAPERLTFIVGGKSSAWGQLRVSTKHTPLVFAASPYGGSVQAGDTFVFSSLAYGTPEPTYQWERNGLPLAGETRSHLLVSEATPADSGEYSVVVSNTSGSITSMPVSLTVSAALDLALDTQNAGLPWITGGANFGWYRQTNYTRDGIDAATCGGPNLLPPYNSPWMQTQVQGPAKLRFSWRFTGPIFPRSGNHLAFTVNGLEQARAFPFLISQWDDETFYLGPGSNILRWAYVRQDVGRCSAFVDQVIVENGGTAAYITVPPVARTVTAGAAITLSGFGAGTPPLSYRWLRNGSIIPGATSNTLNVPEATPDMAGVYTLCVSNNYGPGATADALLTVTTLSLAEALDCAGLTPLSSGATPWFGHVGSAYDSVDAARSSKIADGQQTGIRVPVLGPGVIRFYWRVSSQPGDCLQVSLDGTKQAQISGERPWEPMSVPLPKGNHLLEWVYVKDSSGAGGMDAAWLDQIVYEPESSLSIEVTDAGLVQLSWPVLSSNLVLQSCPSLVSPIVWSRVTNTLRISGEKWILTNRVAEPAAFFRLAPHNGP